VTRYSPKKIVEEIDGLGDINDRSYDPAQPLPFQEILVGFVRYARQQVRAREFLRWT
jgi:hypothetical protein